MAHYKSPKFTGRRCAILTPQARRLQFELIRELGSAAVSRGLTRNQAEASLSAIMCDVWNSVDTMILGQLKDD